MRPARTISRWLTASASAGSSRNVGISERDQRILSVSGYFPGILLAPLTPGS